MTPAPPGARAEQEVTSTRGFLGRLQGLREAGESVVTATVVEVRGATPRAAGARMLVHRDGAIAGSVGGGCGEEQIRREALGVLAGEGPRLTRVDLTGAMSDDSATHCGGSMEIFLDRLAWDERPALGLGPGDMLTALGEAVETRRRPVALAVVTGGGALPAGTRWVIGPDPGDAGCALRVAGRLPSGEGLGPLLADAAASAIAEGGSRRLGAHLVGGRWTSSAGPEDLGLFVEAVAPAPELIVVGAGHIARPLVVLGRLLDFDVTVIDDRAAFASRERFPEADEILVGPVDEALRRRPIGGDTCVVLVTRDHQHDEAALAAVLGTPAAYLGMIGSRRRVREVFRHLTAAGVAPAALRRVHAPIGLDIGAETPAEIATAIAAELIMVRRKGGSPAPARRAEPG